ncbi:MAG: uroporphyrinogen decarboxylase family protein [Arachnia sp.]
MTRRDEFTAILAGEPTGALGSLFWKHFAAGEHAGPAAKAAHDRWIEATDPLVVKVMNEAIYPHEEEFTGAADWVSVAPYPVDHPALVAERELVADMVAAYRATHHVFATVHGVTASAFHARGGSTDYDEKRYQLAQALREDPELVGDRFAVIGRSLVDQAVAFLQAGVDGVFLAALGGEGHLFTDDEFAAYIRPHDIAVLEAVGDAGGLRYLHICKENVVLARYAGYPVDIVQVGEHLNDLSLDDLRAAFPGAVVVGGVDNTDPYFHDGGSVSPLVREAVAADTQHARFIVGADCSLPDDTDPQLVGALSRALRTTG